MNDEYQSSRNIDTNGIFNLLKLFILNCTIIFVRYPTGTYYLGTCYFNDLCISNFHTIDSHIANCAHMHNPPLCFLSFHNCLGLDKSPPIYICHPHNNWFHNPSMYYKNIQRVSVIRNILSYRRNSKHTYHFQSQAPHRNHNTRCNTVLLNYRHIDLVDRLVL